MKEKLKPVPDFKKAVEHIRFHTRNPNKLSLTQVCKDFNINPLFATVLQDMGIITKNPPGHSKKWSWNDKNTWTQNGDVSLLCSKSQEYIREKQREYDQTKKDKKIQFLKNPIKKVEIKKSMVSLGTRIIQDDDLVLRTPLIQYPEKRLEDEIKKNPANLPVNPKPADGFTFNQLKMINTLLIEDAEILHYNGMEFKEATLIKFIVGDDETITTTIYFGGGKTIHRMDTLKLHHRIATINRTENKFILSYN